MPSEEGFADFAVAALPRLLRFGLVLTGDPNAAEDLVQTALGRSLGAWRLGRLDDPQAFVRKVMVNSYVSSRRRHWREVATAELPEGASITDHTRGIDDRDYVWRALMVLPPRQRAVIVLRYYEDLSEREIANLMATSSGTVKSQSARALRRLAELLATTDPDRVSD